MEKRKEKGHSRVRLDLTGQRYGRLTVLGPAANIGTRTAWRCLCDCGRETVVKSSCLREGRTVSCGCVHEKGIGAYLTYVDGTCLEMLRAKRVRRNNTSGVTGVEWIKSRQRWRATICFQGKRRYLGSCVRLEDAARARKQGEEALHDTFLREQAEKTASGEPSQERALPACVHQRRGERPEKHPPPGASGAAEEISGTHGQSRGNPVTQRLDLPRRRPRDGSPPAGYLCIRLRKERIKRS